MMIIKLNFSSFSAEQFDKLFVIYKAVVVNVGGSNKLFSFKGIHSHATVRFDHRSKNRNAIFGKGEGNKIVG